MRMFLLRILFLCTLLFNLVFAAIYIPQNDNEVLEVLSNSKKLNKLKKLQGTLRANPKNADLAYLVAKEYVNLGHQDSNPRYYSYAKSALEPWWDDFDKAPKEIQLLIANVKQFDHDFQGAIKVLNLLLSQNQNFVPALLMRAAIYNTIGDNHKSKQDCMKISDNNSLIKTTCISLADSMGPNLEEAFRKLDSALTSSAEKDMLWSLTIAAELASRLGKDQQAKSYYQKALKLYPNDIYLLSSYSDYLLKHGRHKEVINLLKNKTQHDNLLLRLVIAEQSRGDHAKELETRFRAAHLRGDKRHQREEAMYHLEITHNYSKALSLAKANSQVQKELIDIELLKKATKKLSP